MSKSLFLICFFSALFSFSQAENIEVILENGKTIHAKRYSPRRKFLKVKSIEGQRIKLNYEDLNMVRYTLTHGKDIDTIVKQYVRTSEKKGQLMKRIVAGKCNIYEQFKGSNSYFYTGFNINYYAIKHQRKDQVAQKIYHSGLNVIRSKANKLSTFFKDCPKVTSKIKNINSKKEFIAFVKYYNQVCDD